MKTLLITLLTVGMSLTTLAEESKPTTTDQVQVELTGFVHELTATIKEAKNFTTEQAPGVAREYLEWETLKCRIAIWVAGSLGALGVLLGIAMSIIDDEKPSFGLGFSFVIAVLFGIVITCNASDLIKIKTAPRLYVLEYVKTFIPSK